MYRIWRLAGLAALLAASLVVPARPGAGQSAADAPPMLVSSQDIVIKVADYDGARQQILDAAAAQGAALMDARTKVNAQGKKDGWMRLRLPADHVAALLPAIAGAGRLYAQRVSGNDERSEYEGLERRVGSLRTHEGRLAGVLASDRRLRGSDVLYIQERLFRANVDEGSLLQQRADMERDARRSTVMVTLFEAVPPQESARALWDWRSRYAAHLAGARDDLRHLLGRWLVTASYAVVYAPLWVPALLAALALLWWVWRHRARIWASALRLTRTTLAALQRARQAALARTVPEAAGPVPEGSEELRRL